MNTEPLNDTLLNEQLDALLIELRLAVQEFDHVFTQRVLSSRVTTEISRRVFQAGLVLGRVLNKHSPAPLDKQP